ncbi:MAG TPA: hypothetical protein VLC92_01265 [Rhodocyclaceae bacterium]|nr:hypothetical protein [Rhodocyclaceae bacterium]
MPTPTDPNHPLCSFGDTAFVIEISFLLLLDVIAIEAPHVAGTFVGELDKMLAKKLPTQGMRRQIQQLRDHLSTVLNQT